MGGYSYQISFTLRFSDDKHELWFHLRCLSKDEYLRQLDANMHLQVKHRDLDLRTSTKGTVAHVK